MSNLFTVVSAEQQEIVAGGRGSRSPRFPQIPVVAFTSASTFAFYSGPALPNSAVTSTAISYIGSV